MRCNIRDLDIYYEEYGEGKPFILLHGYYCDHQLMEGCFEPVFKDKPGYRRIYIDLPGMGQTKGAGWIKSSDAMLDIVAEFIDAVLPEESFLLAGESYGGYLARGLVRKMADRVDGLLLLCPCIIADAEKRNIPRHTVLRREPHVLEQLSLADAADFDAIAVVQTEETLSRYKDEILPGLKAADDAFLIQLKINGYEFSFDVDLTGRKFHKPTLMLMGRQDSSVGYEDAWNILDNYPRASFCVLDRSGHNLQIEQPALFASLVDEWLKRVGEAR